jgi:type II restriction enzyme
MRRAIEEDRTPNLFALHYLPQAWKVRSLILIPRFAFSTSMLEKRKPLGPRARRAGWVGCNIVLANIAPDARIPIVADGIACSATEVRRHYARLRPLANLSLEKRGWTLDVLKVVRSLSKQEFSLSDVYTFEDELARLHPANRHIRDKIRQQLQVLRDMGFVDFHGGGKYCLR